MGRMFFNAPRHLRRVRERPCCGCAPRRGDVGTARDQGKLRGKPPKLSDLQQRELLKMHATGEILDPRPSASWSVSRPTVYRTIRRGSGSIAV